MAANLNTDVSAEVNITARRNDTFKLLLEVKGSNTATMDLNDTNTSTNKPEYQAKMTIMSNSGEEILSVFSLYWNDLIAHATGYDGEHPKDRIPTSTAAGYYTGGGTDVLSGINLAAQTGSNGEKVAIIVPYDYMAFQSGVYKYDLQIRYNPEATNVLEYITWIHGSFTLKADITQS
mgnify:CR=1 FL=1